MIDISTSGPIDGQFISEKEAQSVFEEVPSRGYNRLVKTLRQGRWFMLKGLKPEYASQTVYLELLKKEFALMVQLDHPNIVKAYAKEVNAELGPSIVMEYIDGVTLDAFLASNPSFEARRKVADQLADAMAYIHSKQILHRDLKPSNILVTRNGGNVKIIDFGLSDADDYAILKQSAGTVEYMSPELKSSSVIDCRSDIYSFGLVLRRIFPHRYRFIASKCSRKDPDKRYGTMEEVRQSLLHFDRWRMRLPFLCVCALLVALWGLQHGNRPLRLTAGRDDMENITADQRDWLMGAFWGITSSFNKIIHEAEQGETYREVLTAVLFKLTRELDTRRTELSTLYLPGSPEQLYFISECTREQNGNSQVAMKSIDRNSRSFEDDFNKGRISQRAYDSLKWVVSPLVRTLPVIGINASSATGGVELADVSFAEDALTGICWSPCHNPTTDCRHFDFSHTQAQNLAVLDSLAPGTTYFARAYVVTGAGISYGNEVAFTTADSTFAVPAGAVPGLFSVGAGRQVFFSKGNLQYRASTDTWRFAEHQQDFVGDDNMKLSPTYDGWIDLFGWGTSGYDHGAVDWQPWSANKDIKSDALHYAYGDPSCNLSDRDGRADWGCNRISNGGDEEHLWRTPQVSEWMYLFFNRNTASGARFAKALVDGVEGVILLPDNWRSAVYPLNALNEEAGLFSDNIIPTSDWIRVLEPAGAVFLPMAGARTIDGIYPLLGAYYTSDAASSDAWHILFGEDHLRFDARGHRGDGLSVRLVQDAR